MYAHVPLSYLVDTHVTRWLEDLAALEQVLNALLLNFDVFRSGDG